MSPSAEDVGQVKLAAVLWEGGEKQYQRPNRWGYNLLVGAIARVFDVTEPASPKPGHGGLKLLEALG